jgi:hypothetical protein
MKSSGTNSVRSLGIPYNLGAVSNDRVWQLCEANLRVHPVRLAARCVLFTFVFGVHGVESAVAQNGRIVETVSAGGVLRKYARAFSLVQGSQLADHPWSERFSSDSAAFGFASPSVSVLANSGFPFGFNDGAVWAGRGATIVASGGMWVHARHLSLRLEPLGFLTQNAALRLEPNGQTGARAFGAWQSVTTIDLPQRFGDVPYGRIDGGESELRVNAAGFFAALTTAADIWGPAVEHPLILGTNAPGIPRLVLGSGRWIGPRAVRASGRIMWGVVQQTPYGPSSDTMRLHTVTGATGSLLIANRLEIGVARFFHVSGAPGLSSLPWLKVFEGVLKPSLETPSNPIGDRADNQLASFFFRLPAPGRGFEIYGEYGREDHSADLRDFLKEPDHDAAFVLGLQRAWLGNGATMNVVRAELINARISHLQQTASQVPWYVHGRITSGHTNRGQALGSAAAAGGGGHVVAWDRYTPRGRTTVRWDRLMQGELLNASGMPDPSGSDVIQAITVERDRMVRRRIVGQKLSIMKEFNRGFRSDALNFFAGVSVALAR